MPCGDKINSEYEKIYIFYNAVIIPLAYDRAGSEGDKL